MKKNLITTILIFIVAVIVFHVMTSQINYRKSLKSDLSQCIVDKRDLRDRVYRLISEYSGIPRESFNQRYPSIMRSSDSVTDREILDWITQENPFFDQGAWPGLKKNLDLERDSLKKLNAKQARLELEIGKPL